MKKQQKIDADIFRLKKQGRNEESIAREVGVDVERVRQELQRQIKKQRCDHPKSETSGRLTDVFGGCRTFFQLYCAEDCGYVGEMIWNT